MRREIDLGLLFRHSFVIRHSSLAIPFCSSPSRSPPRWAQESPTPSPYPLLRLPPSRQLHRCRRPHVRLRFALPPFDGTISLGIYDAAGKLVRVLHREDTIDDFTAGNDALETVWDGNDDDGNSLPNGKYSARGYVVGDLEVEGVDYFFNDWVTDEKSPHVRRLTQLWMDNGELQIDAELADAKKMAFVCDPTSGAILKETSPIAGKHCKQAATLANVVEVIDCATGRDGTTWSVDLSPAVGRGRSDNLPEVTKSCAGSIMWRMTRNRR